MKHYNKFLTVFIVATSLLALSTAFESYDHLYEFESGYTDSTSTYMEYDVENGSVIVEGVFEHAEPCYELESEFEPEDRVYLIEITSQPSEFMSGGECNSDTKFEDYRATISADPPFEVVTTVGGEEVERIEVGEEDENEDNSNSTENNTSEEDTNETNNSSSSSSSSNSSSSTNNPDSAEINVTDANQSEVEEPEVNQSQQKNEKEQKNQSGSENDPENSTNFGEDEVISGSETENRSIFDRLMTFVERLWSSLPF